MNIDKSMRCVSLSRRNAASAALLVAVLLIALFSMLTALPVSAQEDAAAQIETPTPTATPIPEEWANNIEQTTGIVIGAVILTLIIIGGTLHTISVNRPQNPS
jgi:hypothetical protein